MSSQLIWVADVTDNFDNDKWIIGLFSSAEKAKAHVSKLHPEIVWECDDDNGRDIPTYCDHLEDDRYFYYISAFVLDRTMNKFEAWLQGITE